MNVGNHLAFNFKTLVYMEFIYNSFSLIIRIEWVEVNYTLSDFPWVWFDQISVEWIKIKINEYLCIH